MTVENTAESGIVAPVAQERVTVSENRHFYFVSQELIALLRKAHKPVGSVLSLIVNGDEALAKGFLRMKANERHKD